jgi:hypothetical protein
MTNSHRAARDYLVQLVTRIMAGDFEDEAEEDRAITEFVSSVPHPRATDLIFHWSADFDEEPTPDEVVDRALTYRAMGS